MTLFTLKQLASHPAQAIAGAVKWNYDRAELIADGVVHVFGVLSGLIAATVLIVLTAVYATGLDVAVVSIYVAGLMAMLVFSATYNLWPVSPRKWMLRRFDHSAIYILIAATYTPFIMQVKDNAFAVALLIGVWCVAIVGIILKLVLPGRFDRLSIVLYLAMGWSGFMIYDVVIPSLPTTALWFVVVGGVLYSLGVIFHAWRQLRFQNAIWHSFVLARRSLPLYRGARPRSGLSCQTNAEGTMQVSRQDCRCDRRRQRHWQGAVRSLSPGGCSQGHRCRYRFRQCSRRGAYGGRRGLQVRRRPGKGYSATSSMRPSVSSGRSRCSAPMPESAAASIRCR